MNNLDQFESIIKGAVENYELPYDASAWNKFKKQMPNNNPLNQGGLFAACFSGILITAGLSYFSFNAPITDQSDSSLVAQELISPVKENNITLNTNNDEANAIHNVEQEINDSNTNNEHTTSQKSYTISIDDEDVVVRVEEKTVNGVTTKEVIMETSEGKLVDISENKTVNSNLEQIENENTAEQFIAAIPDIANSDVCVGEEVDFASLNLNEFQEIEWNFGDGYISSSKQASHKYSKPGLYKVILKTTYTKDKTISKEVTGYVNVHDVPSVNVEFNTSDYASRPITEFKVNGNENLSYAWDLGNGKISKLANPTTLYNSKGTKTVTLIASNANCSTTIKKNIYIENDYNLLAPNAFTASGDGLNDMWFPAALVQLNYSFTLSIFDKNTGKLVYKTSSKQPWNGYDQYTGEKCTSQFYVWQVSLTNEFGQIEEYQGSIFNLTNN